jgi:hypothetical protein
VKTLSSIYEEISEDKNAWSYYSNHDFDINGKWNDNDMALNFISSYFDYAEKSQCFKDEHFDMNFYSGAVQFLFDLGDLVYIGGHNADFV